MRTFKKTKKQAMAIDLMAQSTELLLDGGSRSGKTFISVYAIFVRAIKHKKSNHVIVRKHFNHVKLSIWGQTFPKVLSVAFPGVKVKENKSDWFIQFENGSTVYIGGTDDKERIEKILGTEWDTIYLNEASQLPFDTYETLKTRLNPGEGVKPLFLIDYNPPSTNHWGYKIFYKGINPESGQPLIGKDRYAMLKMNPVDNIENLSPGYIQTLDSMSEAKRRRFKLGEYSDESEKALWKREWISKNRITDPNEINRILRKIEKSVVAVDPAVTGKATSDSTGIVISGKIGSWNNEEYYVIDDRTYHGIVTGWGESVCKAYNEFQANEVVGESNQGGDLVEMNIRNYDRNINYTSIHALKGKKLRAEPVADLYERGKVHHLGEFTELEDQMCTWTEESGESPNNMDALVYSILRLSGISEIDSSVLYKF